MKYYLKNKNFVIGSFIILFLLIIVIISFFYVPCDPYKIDISIKLQPPNKYHLLGTDHLGRDILSRFIIGDRISFFIGFIVTVSGFLMGTFLGAIAGYYGKWGDSIIMKLTDTQMAFPGILLALMLIAIFGASLHNTIFALCIMSIPRFTRISRSGFLKFRSVPFVLAEKAKGASTIRIILYHILPNITEDLTVTASLTFADAILSEAGLSYLGLGIQPPTPSFGKMLSEAQGYILQSPWYIFIPAVGIILLVMGFNLIGDSFTAGNT